MSFTTQMFAYARACGACKRRMLVEIPQAGIISYVMDVMPTCWDCLTPKQRKEAAKRYNITEATFHEVEARK